MKQTIGFITGGLAVALILLSSQYAWGMKSNPGLPVKKISFANQIDNWEVIDQTRLLVSLSANRNFLLTLTRACHRLNNTTQVGVSASNNTIYAGFDYVTAAGQRCSIQSISKLSKAEVKAFSD
jgi:hypothetical protein